MDGIIQNVLPEHCGKVKDFTDEDDDHSDEEDDAEYNEPPRMTRSNFTHSQYRSTADVTHNCARVTNTAAVAVFLNSQSNQIPSKM